ncbi:MAG: hypothetical protein WCF66_20880, partial [Pseudolabrys sp.]
AYLSIIVLLVAVKELPSNYDDSLPRLSIRRDDIIALPAAFWWVISIAGLLSLARFSQAFLVLKANDIGVDAAFVPMVLVVMHLVFSLAAYPFGILADHSIAAFSSESAPSSWLAPMLHWPVRAQSG